jgi:membrane associated rhomboid family serine protease/Zn-finger nucleic acid-binding protein
MFIPYSDDNQTRRFPVVNYLLITINVLVYLSVNFQPNAWELIKPYALHPDNVTFVTLISCMFLHSGFLHILGNMLFLHIYGDNIEDKFGHLGYLVFYLTAGVVAGLFHVATGIKPCIGASGAVAGVMGAYVVLYPMAKIRFLFIFIPIIKRIELYSWLVLSFWFGGQLLSHFSTSNAGIAFSAHIGGFICGTIVSGLLLLANRVESEPATKSQKDRAKVRNFVAPPAPEPIDIAARFEAEKEHGLPCPACVKAMQYTDIHGLRLESCFDCGGLWLDRGETETLLQLDHLPYSLLNPPARNTDAILLERGQRGCGHCEQPLAVVDIEGVQAEGCAACGGLWLEKGELGDLKSRLAS